ncbi:hypothetical protein [Fibrobacter sp. UBA4297]|uniref:hypothetical protein n=1 Tax=Fibrobacter sp. UBA4297 TaxID=1946536 RepID=UPI0025C6A8A5|nr:hypothetical protein [Fibrobacter sp. UBA4297]
MKPIKYIGATLVVAAAFGIVACDTDNISAPEYNNVNSSAVEQLNPLQSSSSEAKIQPLSSSEFVESSSAKSESSSSVANLSSSSIFETCKHVSDNVCEPCPSGETCACHPCRIGVEHESRDCLTGATLYCREGEWKTVAEICPNGRWTTHCNGIWAQEPVCCEEKLEETCRHISDYDGMTAQGNCVNQNGRTAVDCVTGENYECKNNNWQPVACMDIKPTECKPGMVGCDYRLCQPDGVREIADCESGAIYVCNGEMWEIKKTEENQHCARGELEYCAACFEEGAFNGHYKCVQGKWLKMGMGDEICEHITDFRCAEGKTRCSIACDENLQKRTQDCKTGEMYVCQSGLWTLELLDCDSDADGCGREILQPTCDAQNGGNCALPLMDYERCARGEKEFCNSNNSWLSESCEESELSRDLRIEMQDGSYRSENYICVKGRWVERYKYYECGEKESCVTASVRCPSLGVEGTACSENGSSKVVDSCAFTCSNGVYKYTPAPL